MRHIFSAPTVVNIEVTDACNVRCRHCYNFWREDGSRSFSLDKDMMERMIDIIAEAGVFHAVLSGGEPFAAFDVLEYGFKKLQEKHISVSCNSNLMLANDEKIKRLMDVGVDHILTSLNSYDAKINDYMVNKEGAFDRIVKGIDSAVRNGMRVSANMIVSQRNKNHVYKTGKLVYDLGCQKMFGTRVVPSDHIGEKNQPDFVMDKEDAVNTLEQLVKVKEDTGMMIGTLVSYPLCLLSDLERYVDFVGRGCPAQSGHVVNISANGETHACVHQEAGYGNIFEIGIIEPYQKMSTWHTGAYRFKGCDGCDYLEICKTGCRMSSLAYTGKYDQKDNFMVSKDNFVKPFKIVVDDSIYENIDKIYCAVAIKI